MFVHPQQSQSAGIKDLKTFLLNILLISKSEKGTEKIIFGRKSFDFKIPVLLYCP